MGRSFASDPEFQAGTRERHLWGWALRVPLVLVMLASMLVATSPGAVSTTVPAFSDVPAEHVFATEIAWLASTGITQGRGDGTFGVSDPVTRGAMAAFLFRFDGEPEGPSDVPAFSDVPAEHVFATEIAWLASTGITQGRGDGTFSVSDPVTRGAMAAFLFRYDDEREAPVDAPAFTDVSTEHTFATEIAWLASTGITQGRGDGTFGVSDPVTRGAMAAFLFRFAGEPALPQPEPSPDPAPDPEPHPEFPVECSVRSLTPDDGFDPFYDKGCAVDSFWTVASSEVPDRAVKRASDIATAMLDGLAPEQQSLVSRNIRLGVIGVDENVTDLPEYSDLYEVFPGMDWDALTRGLGATLERPLVSASEENLLCLSGDRYAGESILVHELAHTILDHGVVPTRPGFRPQLEAAYASAMEAGIWDDTYAATNADEYWAEAVQSYFDVNLFASPPDGIHGPIATREALAGADATLHDLIREVWGDRTVETGCP